MTRWYRIYFNTLLGALGGLIGWMLFGEWIDANWNWWQSSLAGGALIGAVIGYGLAGAEALQDAVFIRFIRFASMGTVLGAIGGALGFWLGESIHYVLLPATGELTWSITLGLVISRALGWAFFGLAVGMSEGLAARSLRLCRFGAIGGALGGALGGAVFGTLMVLWDPTVRSYMWGQALGLIVLGGCIGLLTALVEKVLQPASLLVIRGWREGREFRVVKRQNRLGRDETADILLLRDMSIAKQHAVISQKDNGYVIILQEGTPEQTLINGAPVYSGQNLKDGDRLQIGATVLRFSQRRASHSRPILAGPSHPPHQETLVAEGQSR